MKQDKVCISTKVGYFSFFILILTVAIFAMSQAVEVQKSTSSRASEKKSLTGSECKSNILLSDSKYTASNDTCSVFNSGGENAAKALDSKTILDKRGGTECSILFSQAGRCVRKGDINELGNAYCKVKTGGACVKSSSTNSNASVKCAFRDNFGDLIDGVCTGSNGNAPVPSSSTQSEKKGLNTIRSKVGFSTSPTPTPYEGVSNNDCGWGHVNCSAPVSEQSNLSYYFDNGVQTANTPSQTEMKCVNISYQYRQPSMNAEPKQGYMCVFDYAKVKVITAYSESGQIMGMKCDGKQYAMLSDKDGRVMEGACYTTAAGKGKDPIVLMDKGIMYCPIEVWSSTSMNAKPGSNNIIQQGNCRETNNNLLNK